MNTPGRTLILVSTLALSATGAHALGARTPFDPMPFVGTYELVSCKFEDEYYEYNTPPGITGAVVSPSDGGLLVQATGDVRAHSYGYSFADINQGKKVHKSESEGYCHKDEWKNTGSGRRLQAWSRGSSSFMCLSWLFRQSSSRRTEVELSPERRLTVNYTGSGGLLWNHSCVYQKLPTP